MLRPSRLGRHPKWNGSRGKNRDTPIDWNFRYCRAALPGNRQRTRARKHGKSRSRVFGASRASRAKRLARLLLRQRTFKTGAGRNSPFLERCDCARIETESGHPAFEPGRARGAWIALATAERPAAEPDHVLLRTRLASRSGRIRVQLPSSAERGIFDSVGRRAVRLFRRARVRDTIRLRLESDQQYARRDGEFEIGGVHI